MNAFGQIAAVVAGSLIAASAMANEANPKKAAVKDDTKGECHGVNACKGKGECGGPGGNSCAGTNSCKGKGWITLTAKDCKTKGGKFKAEPAEHK